MTNTNLSKQALRKKSAADMSVNPIYAYGEYWQSTGSQAHCDDGKFWHECVEYDGDKMDCAPGSFTCK